MKQLIPLCLLVMGAATYAQTPTPATAPASTRGDAKRESEAAQRSADDAKKQADEKQARAKLEEARARLDKAAREVAELSSQLAHDSQRDMMFFNTDRRAVLGVQIDANGGKGGARVLHVSPGGPAEEAGLQTGDVIVALDGKAVAGGEGAGRAVVEKIRGVKPDEKVKVRVIRAGKNKDFIVVARPRMFETFDIRGPEMGAAFTGAGPGLAGMAGMPQIRRFRFAWPGEFEGLELASITPKLGAYFGANEGVLVVQAPENGAFKLEDGDVIQSIDGRKIDDGAHALRILRSYQSGEKLSLQVLRQRNPVTLAVTMPERPEFHDDFMGVMPPGPPVPPMPAMPGSPGGPGTDE
jgi:C-terminal processing protease CtpA/Prc